jgi:DNA replication factor GINS
MNIDELRTVQTKERQKDSLQHLRDEFYEDVADYIRDLKAERKRAASEADDPFSDPEVSRLTDEIETAEEVVEAVYERRVGKVVKLSSFAAADMPVDEEGLTSQERDLFEDLVARIGENKTRVLDILAGQGDAGKATTAPSSSADPEAFGATEEAPGAGAPDGTDAGDAPTETPTDDSPERSEPAFGTGGSDSATTPSAPPDDTDPQAPPDAPPSTEAAEVLDRGSDEVADHAPDSLGTDPAASEPTVQSSTPDVDPEMADDDTGAERTTVRVTADVGRVLGVDDREYDLKSEDVVDLPSDNANALLQRDAAEKLE